MKNLAYKVSILTVIFMVIISCSTVKKLPADVAGRSRARFVGTWTLSSVNYEGLVQGTVQSLFDQAAPEDFIGSTWKLTNSGQGSYTLVSGTSQTIFWSFESNGAIFQFKKIYRGDPARKVQDGYQLVVASINDTQLVLKSPVVMGNQTAYVVLSFNKVVN